MNASGGVEENRYSVSRRYAEQDPTFIDLINTNFQQCGFRYPQESAHRAAAGFLRDAHPYAPDPKGSRGLREAIGRFYQRTGGGQLPDADADSIIVTASASESYSHILAGVLSRGDHVLLPTPGYPLFEDVVLRAGLQSDSYQLDGKTDWRIDPCEMEKQVRQSTRAVVVISPNNPTGNVIDHETARFVIDLCSRHKLALIVDEVFSAFTYGVPHVRPAALVGTDGPLVFTINGLSKLMAGPDLKISWIAVTGPSHKRGHIMNLLEIQNDLFLSASGISQAMGMHLLDENQEFTTAMVDEIEKRRAVMLDEIAGTPGVSVIPPAGGIHVPVSFDPASLPPNTDDEALVVDLMDRHGVGMHPGYFYGIETPVTVVMSFLSPAQAIREAFQRIRGYLSSPRS